MAKLKMKRIELLGLLSDSKEIIDVIQRKGIVEFEDVESYEGLQKLDTSTTVSQFEKYITIAENTLEILNQYCPENKSLLDSFSGRKEMTISEYIEKSDEADGILTKCYDITALQKRITDCNADIVRYENLAESLLPWNDFDIKQSFKGTEKTVAFIGTLPEKYDEMSLSAAIAENVPDVENITDEVISSDDDQTCIFVLCMKDDREAVEQGLRKIGFVKPASPTDVNPKNKIEDYRKKADNARAEIEKAKNKIIGFKSFHKDIRFVIDYFNIRRDKYDSLKKLAMSNKIFVLKGFIPEKYCKALTDKLENKYCIAIETYDPQEDDDFPVTVENNAFAGAVESITTMYSTPSNNDIDPNPVMAFFYYAFFGLMLSDAGYGVIMVIAMLFAKKKMKLESNMKKTVNMFLYCGISTVFWGTMFGSWFGDLIPTIYTQILNKPAPRMYVWLEPVNDPMKLMLYCFLFGIIHLFVGLGVRFYQLWKSGKRLDAICDVVFVYLFVAGVAPIGAGIIQDMPAIATQIGKYLMIVGAAGIVLTSGRSAKNILGKLGGGLYGLYNTASGYLGDILSYSRLLALGLSTGVIASVVNMLGTMPENRVLKTIMLIVVGLIGHTVNMAINLIGTYVHTSRLQYVEFFSKFYEGGGRSFTPLNVNTKYFKFKEENNNG